MESNPKPKEDYSLPIGGLVAVFVIGVLTFLAALSINDAIVATINHYFNLQDYIARIIYATTVIIITVITILILDRIYPKLVYDKLV